MRRAMLVVPGLLFAACALASFLLVPAPLAPGPQLPWQEVIAGCRDEGSGGVDPECIRPAWMQAARDGRAAALSAAFASARTLDPRVEVGCHEVAHEVGRWMQQQADSLNDALAQALDPGHGCDSGLLHGVMDSFSVEQPDQAWRIREFCQSLPDAGMGATCAHGSGHAAWPATRSPAAAARWCEQYEDSRLQGLCAFGAVMQMYREETDGSAGRLLASGVERDLPRICAAMAQATGSWEIERQCYLVAPFEFALQLQEPTRGWATSGQGLQSVAAAWDRALEGCAVMGPDGPRDCVKQVLAYVPRLLPGPARPVVRPAR